jgi:crotonobetainyl-CoA:carnitine CoA-transferase CaiB-like acyl-CoA transferase
MNVPQKTIPEISSAAKQGIKPMRPLEGLRVVDLTRVLSGPFCTMQLGDLGAEVIKVERPGEGDDTRAFAPPYQGDEAAYFLSVNRNKKSITLDMKSERGREVLWRLIDKSDVLVETPQSARGARPWCIARFPDSATPA